MVPKLKEKYNDEILPKLKDAGAYGNRMQVPRLEKIVINMALSTSVDKDALKEVAQDLAMISGQQPAITRAKNSIANFKLREGMPIGAKVTLRGKRMYEFLERLINVALPRIRDFRGISAKSFDGRGNYSLGIAEQSIFPEINPDRIKKVQGMDITFVTSADTNEEALELLKGFGMPFAK